MEERSKILIIIFALVLLGVGSYVANLIGFRDTQTGAWRPLVITQTNIASVLSRTNIVQEIPEGGVISIYIGELPYTVQKGTMTAGAPARPDATIRLPESYLAPMGQHGPCAALALARQNGELVVEMHESAGSLAWKYRALAKYRSCLG